MSSRRLYQFRHSHFSEKARWALDYKGLAYEKVDLTRGPHLRVIERLGVAESTVPVLVEPDGTTVQDSTAILDHLEARYPEPPLDPQDPTELGEARALEELFDDKLGYHIRRFAYAALIDRPDALAFMFLQGKGLLARLSFPLIYRLMRPRMVRRLRLGPGAGEESANEIRVALDTIDAQLAEGPYLVGERFTRADLTAASLLSLLTWPPEHEFEFPPASLIPPEIARFLDEIVERPVHAWSLRMYSDHRHR